MRIFGSSVTACERPLTARNANRPSFPDAYTRKREPHMTTTGTTAAVAPLGATADLAQIGALVDPVAAAQLASHVRGVIFVSQ